MGEDLLSTFQWIFNFILLLIGLVTLADVKKELAKIRELLEKK